MRIETRWIEAGTIKRAWHVQIYFGACMLSMCSTRYPFWKHGTVLHYSADTRVDWRIQMRRTVTRRCWVSACVGFNMNQAGTYSGRCDGPGLSGRWRGRDPCPAPRTCSRWRRSVRRRRTRSAGWCCPPGPARPRSAAVGKKERHTFQPRLFLPLSMSLASVETEQNALLIQRTLSRF